MELGIIILHIIAYYCIMQALLSHYVRHCSLSVLSWSSRWREDNINSAWCPLLTYEKLLWVRIQLTFNINTFETSPTGYAHAKHDEYLLPTREFHTA